MEYPKSFNPKKEDIKLEDIIKPLVAQCRYSGIFVPEDLIESVYINTEVDYYTANYENNDVLFDKLGKIIDNLLEHLDND